jgi:hypothetical protein
MKMPKNKANIIVSGINYAYHVYKVNMVTGHIA